VTEARRKLTRSTDGTAIAWFTESAGAGAGEGSSFLTERNTVVLVHGTTADHTTWRVFGPRLAASRPVISMDRRGRGGSDDTPPYAIEREYEDVAAVARAVGAAHGRPVDLLGHSYGGRCALGAATRAPDAIRRVVTYEGAVSAGVGTGDLERLEALAEAGRWETLLEVFLREVVDMTDDEWRTFRDAPVWPARVAAAPTIVRELRAGRSEAAAWSGYADVRQPVLQVLGSESPPFFRAGAEALGARLRRGRLEVVAGARHAAHHTHPDVLLALVARFLDAPEP
jgi:pimeloyl-ACP methyl ester carboxylesterase